MKTLSYRFIAICLIVLGVSGCAPLLGELDPELATGSLDCVPGVDQSTRISTASFAH
jgi:hypothetical protein